MLYFDSEEELHILTQLKISSKKNNFPEPEFSFSRNGGGGGLLSSGEFFNSAESLTTAFTCFSLQASNSQPPTDKSPSTCVCSWLVPQVSYTQHLHRHLGTELPHGCTRQAAARIPREDPHLYIASCSDTERS